MSKEPLKATLRMNYNGTELKLMTLVKHTDNTLLDIRLGTSIHLKSVKVKISTLKY